MAAYVDQTYYGWSHEEFPDHNESQEVSVSQMLDHGSISFGRFAFESLSWEKRSVFTHNKCQEELEKFKSPGLVAQKKAYFEEYYKKIRAMKALQENQQTELTLDYGGDGSISSQTGEEDETAVHLESHGDGAPNVIDARSEEASSEVTMEKEKDCSEALQVQTRHLDMETALPILDSPRKSLAEFEQEINSCCALQMQHLDTESTVDKSLMRSKKEIEQHDLSNLDDKGVSRKYNNSVLDVEPEASSHATALHPTNSKPEDSELKPAYGIISDKIMFAVKKYKDCVSVPKVKEPCAPVRIGLKLGSKTKSGIVKPSQAPRYPSQKTNVKAERSVASGKATADRVSRNDKSASVASHRPLTEVHSNVTIPRPFSLATERRAAVPSGIREGALRSDSKTSNKLASSSVHGKDVINVQVSSKRTVTTSSVKSGGLEIKRSINLPAHSKLSSNGRIETRFKDAVVREDKRREGKEETRLREIRWAGTKTSAPHRDGNLSTETRKMVPLGTSKLSVNSRKPRFGEQSLDGKKPRQEKRRWR